jgi:hypothetical protein
MENNLCFVKSSLLIKETELHIPLDLPSLGSAFEIDCVLGCGRD